MGDIHGEANRLASAILLAQDAADRIVFVGDYVDRGPASRDVIDQLIDLKSSWSGDVTLLRGNHDDALLRFLEIGGGGTRESFIAHGGLATAKSYLRPPVGSDPLSEFRAGFPTKHYELLYSTEYYFEEDGLFVSHCGYNPEFPKCRSLDAVVNGSFPGLFTSDLKDRPQSNVIFGHYVQVSGMHFERNGVFCIDTGCGTIEGGRLSVLLFPELRVVAV